MKTKYVRSNIGFAMAAIFTNAAFAGSLNEKPRQALPAVTCKATNMFSGVPSTLDLAPKSDKTTKQAALVHESWMSLKQFPENPRISEFLSKAQEWDPPLFRHMDFSTEIACDQQSATDRFYWAFKEFSHPKWNSAFGIQIDAVYAIDNVGRPEQAYLGLLFASFKHK